MLLRCKKAVQKHSIKIAKTSFEGVAKFKYLETTPTDQNCMNEEIKSRLISGNACYHSVRSILSSRLLSRNVKVKIDKTIIPPVVLYGCGTWSLTLREEYRLRVFENRVLRRIFGPKRDEVTGEWRKLHSEELHNLYSFPDIIRQITSRRLRWTGHVERRERRGKYTQFWWESPKERTTWKKDVLTGGRDQNGYEGIGLARGLEWIQLAQDRGR
jgi:hypothetical protein